MKKSLRNKERAKLKVALVYDRVNKFGGAERVLLSLHKIFPEAPLYTLVANTQTAPWSSVFKVIPSFFNQLPFLRSRHELLTLLAPIGFESFNLDQFDVVISVTSADAKGVVTKPGTLHLCYCLTPTRYLWSGALQYHRSPGFGRLNWLAKPLFGRVNKFLQDRDLVLSSRPDVYWSISKTVQKRVKKYYSRDSQVVYPGINYDFFAQGTTAKSDYYLLVGRLVPYKKADIVIRAFNILGKKLVIIGTGSEEKRLKNMAGPTIKFLGAIGDEQLRRCYQEAKAIIFPQIEDYGLVPLEAQAAGTPVIALNKGGAGETIVDGKTGIFYNCLNTSAIIRAINTFERRSFTPKEVKANAYRFREEIFIENFRIKLNQLWNKQQKTFL